MTDNSNKGKEPAFPTDGSQGLTSSQGMTLRDYFAGQALAGILSRGSMSAPGASKLAYCAADAMIKEREWTPVVA